MRRGPLRAFHGEVRRDPPAVAVQPVKDLGDQFRRMHVPFEPEIVRRRHGDDVLDHTRRRRQIHQQIVTVSFHGVIEELVG